MKNNSIAKQALLDMEAIKASIKEESKKTMQSLLSEAVKDALRESAKEEGDEDDYEVQDEQGAVTPDNQEAPVAPADGAEQAEAPVDGGEQAVAQEEGGEAEEAPEDVDAGWEEFEDYKVGDDTYDLTGVEDPEQVVKVYKLLKNDDQVAVRKEGNKVSVKDNETDAEYVIDLGGGEEEEEPQDMPEVEGEEEVEPEVGAVNEEAHDPFYEDGKEDGHDGWQEDAEVDFELDDDEDLELDQSEPSNVEDEDEYWDKKFAEKKEDEKGFDFPVSPEEEGGDESAYAGLNENKNNTRKAMKEGKNKKQELVFEVDLGYTDSYQKKDPIAGLSNSEPSKQGRSWDEGVPTGTEKPWAGKQTKKESMPFDVVAEEETEKVEPEVVDKEQEIEENVTVTKAQKRHMVKTMAPDSGEISEPYVTKVTSVAGKQIAEIKKQNKELKEAVLALKKTLNESYVTNVNLGKITKLFLENTTSQAEKVDIINRFCNEAKTIEQSIALYESIDKELKKNKTVVKENTVQAAKPVVVEQKTKKSSDLLATIDLMNRVINL